MWLGKWANFRSKLLRMKWVNGASKFLETFLSYDIKGNDQSNFNLKIQELQTRNEEKEMKWYLS